MPLPPPLPAAVPANAGCIRRRYSLRKLRVGFSTGSPSAARRSALERDAAANPSHGVRLGRRRGPRATAPSAARRRPLRAPPRRPVLLLLLLFAGEEAGRQSEEGPVDFDFLALLSKPKDYYKILEVNYDASEETIRNGTLTRNKVKKWQPPDFRTSMRHTKVKPQGQHFVRF